MKFVFILAGIALALEMFGPFILSKLFPQPLLAPAPDVPVRPKRAAARSDSHVDEAVENLPGISTSAQHRERGTSDGLVSSMTAGTSDSSMLSPETFDYDEFRRENESVQAVVSEPFVSQGVPDMFDDSVTSAHA